jgi:hypothetical protein
MIELYFIVIEWIVPSSTYSIVLFQDILALPLVMARVPGRAQPAVLKKISSGPALRSGKLPSRVIP